MKIRNTLLAATLLFPASQLAAEEAKAPTTAVVDALIGALKDSDVEVRAQAASTLGRFRDPRAVPGLLQALKDENATVRRHAASGLGRIRDPKATDALLVALRDT